MKPKIIIFAISNLLICNLLISQSINGKLGTGGQFIIRDTNNTFLTVPQSTGYLSLNRSFMIPNTTSSSLGVIFKGSSRFIHDYQAPGTGGSNTFIGINSGNFTMSGTSTQASNNTGVGYESLTSLTTGFFNSALGNQSLYSNTTGARNSAFGIYSLYSSTTGNNNSAFGYYSLSQNTTGAQNTALGYFAGNGITTGSNNITIGYDAQVPSGTSSNQVRIGNTSITYAGIQVAWTITSDKRLKSGIQNSDLSLNFINKLRPVSYFRNNDESQRTEYGFIAQEVEEVLEQSGANNTGMITIDDNGLYELRYNDLLAPMVKAIQELGEENEKLKDQSEQLQVKNENLEERLAKYEQVQIVLVKRNGKNEIKGISDFNRFN